MTDYSAFDDQQLSELLKAGDRLAYTEIYARYHAGLYLHVFGKLRLREESRDIVHDLFAGLWNRHAELELSGKLATYLYVAARYKVFDFIARREKAHKYMDSLGDFIEKDTYVADYLVRENQLQELIDKEIAALPAKMREVFELSRKQHLSHKQIAAVLGISEQTVKTQVNNALKILRNKLGSAIFVAFVL